MKVIPNTTTTLTPCSRYNVIVLNMCQCVVQCTEQVKVSQYVWWQESEVSQAGTSWSSGPAEGSLPVCVGRDLTTATVITQEPLMLTWDTISIHGRSVNITYITPLLLGNMEMSWPGGRADCVT